MYDTLMLSQTNIFGYSGARVQGSRPGSDNVMPSAAKMMPSQNTALAPTQPVSIVNHPGITNENNFKLRIYYDIITKSIFSTNIIF